MRYSFETFRTTNCDMRKLKMHEWKNREQIAFYTPAFSTPAFSVASYVAEIYTKKTNTTNIIFGDFGEILTIVSNRKRHRSCIWLERGFRVVLNKLFTLIIFNTAPMDV